MQELSSAPRSIGLCPENPVSQNQSNSVTRQDLVAFALGELTPEQSACVQAAVASSPDLQAQLSRVQSTASLLGEARLFDPPASIVQNVLRLVAAPVVQRSWFDRAAGVLADLVFDSLATPTLAGFRGSVDPATRHMTFDSGAGEVDLEIRAPGPGSASFHVAGQIVPASAASKIEIGYLEIATGAIGQCTADEHGKFQFEVKPGTWDLRFAIGGGGEQTLALPRLTIG